MISLDCITIVSDSTPKSFVNECIRSIEVAAKFASYGVNSIITPGVPGDIGLAMANGVAKSTSDWVCFVDDDDFLLPSAFSCLTRHFAASPMAICAREIHLGANGRLVPVDRRHHLTAWRRDVFDHLKLTEIARPLEPLLNFVEHEAVDEYSWCYVYRMRISEGMKLRTAHGRRV